MPSHAICQELTSARAQNHSFQYLQQKSSLVDYSRPDRGCRHSIPHTPYPDLHSIRSVSGQLEYSGASGFSSWRHVRSDSKLIISRVSCVRWRQLVCGWLLFTTLAPIYSTLPASPPRRLSLFIQPCLPQISIHSGILTANLTRNSLYPFRSGSVKSEVWLNRGMSS